MTKDKRKNGIGEKFLTGAEWGIGSGAMIHALPGMGADRTMFPSPWESLPDIVIHDWPAYQGQRSLGEVGRTVCDAFGIQDGDTLVGASLGGMVACEVAKLRRLEGWD